jgi:hypothetical protein
MSAKPSNSPASPARQDLEQTLACVGRITRQFDVMTEHLKRDNDEIAALSEKYRSRGGGSPKNPGRIAPTPALQEIEQSLARKKALGKELCDAAAIFARELIKWAEGIEKSEARQDAGEQIARDATDERAVEAAKMANLAQLYSEKAQDENQEAALALDAIGMGDEYERHKSAAKSASDLAEEMRRRAYILAHGQEGNYRKLMLDQYGVNNANLNTIAAYYAEKFNDQATLNWLSLQHPAPHLNLDANALAMMLMFPEAGEGEEAPQPESTAEKDPFEQANKIENAETVPSKTVGSTTTTPLNRPHIRNWVRNEVESAAPKAADGRFIDSNTLLPTESPVLGHKPGYEFWRLKAAAEAEGVSQELFNETLNNPEFYQIEDASSNASHQFEEP